jgi:hypothetical protein
MKRVGKWLLLYLAFFTLATCAGQVWLAQAPGYLVMGWIHFLVRTVPQVSLNVRALGEVLVVVAGLGVGLHLFLVGAWRRMRSPEATPPVWPVRWSVSLLALLVLLFLSTMSTVGIGHQVGWLFNKQQPLLRSTWDDLPQRQWGRARQLCVDLQPFLEKPPPGQTLSQYLLTRDAQLRKEAERMHVVRVRGEGGKETVLVFPRDPVEREAQGVVRCFSGDEKSVPAHALPQLLAGESPP